MDFEALSFHLKQHEATASFRRKKTCETTIIGTDIHCQHAFNVFIFNKQNHQRAQKAVKHHDREHTDRARHECVCVCMCACVHVCVEVWVEGVLVTRNGKKPLSLSLSKWVTPSGAEYGKKQQHNIFYQTTQTRTHLRNT